MPNDQDELTQITDIGEVADSLRCMAIRCCAICKKLTEPDTIRELEVIATALANNAEILESYFQIDSPNYN